MDKFNSSNQRKSPGRPQVEKELEDLDVQAERWIQSVKTEVLSQMILFGERSLRYVLSEYIVHYRAERPHQGKGNVILFPSAKAEPNLNSPTVCRERLGGLLNYYHRKAA